MRIYLPFANLGDFFRTRILLKACFVTISRDYDATENFIAHLTSSGCTSFSQDASQEDAFIGKRSTSGSVKLKTIKKGWSTEGDKLLEYLVNRHFINYSSDA